MGEHHTVAHLGEAIAWLRRLRRMTQQELAVATRLSKTAIAQIEQGNTVPRLSTAQAISGTLKVPLVRVNQLAATFEAMRADSLLGGPPAEVHRDLRQDAAALFAEIGARTPVEAPGLAASRRQAPSLWAGLQLLPEEMWEGAVLEAGDLLGAGFCELLCEESRRAAPDAAARAIRLATLAATLADNLHRGGSPRVRGYCLAHLANAMRVEGADLPAAERFFARAWELWQAGAEVDAGLFNEARMLHLRASLCRSHRRLDQALALLDQAIAIDRWGETPSLLVSKAKALEELGDYAGAVAVLQQAAARQDEGDDPRHRFMVRAHHLANLCYLGRHREAARMIPEVRSLCERLGNDLDRLRVEWLEGQVAAALRRHDEAVAKLGHVQQELARRGMAYDAALATLELAEVHAAAGDTAAVRALALQSAPIFRAQGVHREARMACELFRRAAARQAATTDAIRRLVVYLQRAQHDPALRFEVGGDGGLGSESTTPA